ADFDDFHPHAQSIARANRLEPTQLVDSRRPERVRLVHQPLHHQPHASARRVPAAGDQASEGRPCRRLLVGVKGLRVVAAPKGDDLLLAEREAAQLVHFAGPEIFEITLAHAHLVTRLSPVARGALALDTACFWASATTVSTQAGAALSDGTRV